MLGVLARQLGGAEPGYALTDAGRALLPVLEQITRWAEEHLPPR
jgi:DNA-binding HxlR family transcriptional regulator